MAGVLGIPGSPAVAIRGLERAERRTIDMGEVAIEPVPVPPVAAQSARATPDAHPGTSPERTAFLVGVGIGFDARVMATTPADLKRRLGRAAYFAQAAWLAARIDVVPYHITVDGERIDTEGSIAMALNLGELVPGSVATRLPVVPDDGLLDVFVLGARGPIAGVRGLLDHLLRTDLGHGAGGSTIRLRGRRVRLESVPPEPMQVDGDHLGPGALEAWVHPAALCILQPT
jgi:diacylglycerol kinase family enzyme